MLFHKIPNYPNKTILPHFQSGFALPMVMLLGIGLTFILSTVISNNTGGMTLQDQAKQFTQRQALQYGFDRVLADVLSHMNQSMNTGYNINMGSGNSLSSCFGEYDSNTVLSAKGQTSNPAFDNDIDYALRYLSRHGYALRLETLADTLSSGSFGRYGLARNFAIDMWIEITSTGEANLLSAPGTPVIPIISIDPANPPNSGKAQLSVLGTSHTPLLEVNQWYYLLITKINGTTQFHIGQTSLSSHTTTASAQVFEGGEWVINTNTADINIATVRAWEDIPSNFDITAQWSLDRDKPGSVYSSPEWALFVDANSTTNFFSSQWGNNSGKTNANVPNTITSVATVIPISSISPHSERFAPPTSHSRFLLDLCTDNQRESHQLQFSRNELSGSITWIP